MRRSRYDNPLELARVERVFHFRERISSLVRKEGPPVAGQDSAEECRVLGIRDRHSVWQAKKKMLICGIRGPHRSAA